MSIVDYHLYNLIHQMGDVSLHNPFKDKWISIIGDQYSSFTGWNKTPSGDISADYYCSSVSKMWWHQLLTKLGAKLCVLWTRHNYPIMNTQGESTPLLIQDANDNVVSRLPGMTYMNIDGTETECDERIDPDFIIIAIGQYEYSLGNMPAISNSDGPNALGVVDYNVDECTHELTSAQVLNNAIIKLTNFNGGTTARSIAHPKVILMTNIRFSSSERVTGIYNKPFTDRNINDLKHDIARKFGINVIDIEKLGLSSYYYNQIYLDDDYPSESFMHVIAEYAYKQMLMMEFITDTSKISLVDP